MNLFKEVELLSMADESLETDISAAAADNL